MKKLKNAGTCPKCGDDLGIFISKSRKRWIECGACGFSYAIPKYGKISKSGLECPKDSTPLLIIEKGGTSSSSLKKTTYFWAREPCFQCSKRGSCKPVLELREEYELDKDDIRGSVNESQLNRQSSRDNILQANQEHNSQSNQQLDIYQLRKIARLKRIQKLKATRVISD